MLTRTVIQNILGLYYPEWRDQSPLPPDLLFMCMDHLTESGTMYRPDGTLKREGVSFNGMRYGNWTHWHQNGKLSKQELFHNDKYEGKKLVWWHNGNLKYEFNYVNGELHGDIKSWDKEGQFTGHGFYNKGKAVGVWKNFYPNLNCRLEIPHKNGKKHGQCNEWYDDEKKTPKAYAQYKNGLINGELRGWWKSGQLKELSFYVNGKLHGESTYWYTNGQCRERKFFENGEEKGDWTVWNKAGRMVYHCVNK